MMECIKNDSKQYNYLEDMEDGLKVYFQQEVQDSPCMEISKSSL